jgi:hypothetical protein
LITISCTIEVPNQQGEIRMSDLGLKSREVSNQPDLLPAEGRPDKSETLAGLRVVFFVIYERPFTCALLDGFVRCGGGGGGDRGGGGGGGGGSGSGDALAVWLMLYRSGRSMAVLLMG